MNNVLIQTCIRVEDGQFVPIDKADLKDIRGFDTGAGNDIPGVVKMEIYTVPVVTCDMWDEVNYVWREVVSAVYKCINGEVGDAYSPSRAITLRLECIKSVQGIKVSTFSRPSGEFLSKGVVAPAEEFVQEFVRDGHVFLNNISRFTSADYGNERNKLSEISRFSIRPY